jgi:hypothetical protein
MGLQWWQITTCPASLWLPHMAAALPRCSCCSSPAGSADLLVGSMHVALPRKVTAARWRCRQALAGDLGWPCAPPAVAGTGIGSLGPMPAFCAEFCSTKGTEGGVGGECSSGLEAALASQTATNTLAAINTGLCSDLACYEAYGGSEAQADRARFPPGASNASNHPLIVKASCHPLHACKTRPHQAWGRGGADGRRH